MARVNLTEQFGPGVPAWHGAPKPDRHNAGCPRGWRGQPGSQPVWKKKSDTLPVTLSTTGVG